MPGRIEALVLPGSELEAAPVIDRNSPLVLRIIAVYPHGTMFRYDIEYTGFVPGEHDLRPYLQRKDGTSTANLPAITVRIRSVLPNEQQQVEPNKLEIEPTPQLGGYRFWLTVLGILWGLGLLVILGSFVFPRRTRHLTPVDTPVSLADRLRPLVERAAAGKASAAELAALERYLMTYWRRQLNLESLAPADAAEQLRHHPEAGPLLLQLEHWLHRPQSDNSVDVAKLLEPYRNIATDALDSRGEAPR